MPGLDGLAAAAELAAQGVAVDVVSVTSWSELARDIVVPHRGTPTTLVRAAFQKDPRDGCWFLFFNKRRDRVKLLWWDGDGYALWYKRLESGTFETLKPQPNSATLELDATELSLLLSGVTLSSVHRRKRFAASV